ncbi:hypothetical protein QA640_32190 [Bradyrhizobium sp. CB82]|uniref:hypothetical protein n=1 Tax=Bradyrhizobium sp. CB82 TaxID=3039159 RepID=UPI0024B14925|nr:hypothetical protein [Bradyrhizobium sp. CB82]WFU39022.1 hypothetical protein QA640_32190 [Bradyrhizobium sp. CB82]
MQRRLDARQGGALRQRAENGICRFRHYDRAPSQLGRLDTEKPAPAVVFATLFFLETFFPERLTIPITAMLTSAVLPLTIDNQLGDVGYTVAVEKLFYVFLAPCLMTMLAGFGHERLRHAGRKRLCGGPDRTAQILYVGTALAATALFWWRYALGFSPIVGYGQSRDGVDLLGRRSIGKKRGRWRWLPSAQ